MASIVNALVDVPVLLLQKEFLSGVQAIIITCVNVYAFKSFSGAFCKKMLLLGYRVFLVVLIFRIWGHIWEEDVDVILDF